MAILVLIGHGSYYYAGDIGWLIPSTNNQIALGRFPVDVFFIISGFLITASFMKKKSVTSFVWNRFLRIYPAYFVCIIIIGLIVAPVFGISTELSYIYHNLLLVRGIDNSIVGLFSMNPGGSGVNGSLWTLPWELKAYLMVLILGVIGIFKSKISVVLLFLASWLYLSIIIISQESIMSYDAIGSWQRLFTFFLAGMVVYIFKNNILLNGKLAFLSFLLLMISIWIGNKFLLKGAGAFYLVAPIFLTYLVFYLSYVLPFYNINNKNDLSYGIYIYGTLVLQMISSLGMSIPMSLYLLIACIITVFLATISWFLIEKPILKYKRIL